MTFFLLATPAKPTSPEPKSHAAVGLGEAAAVYVTSRNIDHARSMAVTLHRLYPHLDVNVRVRTHEEQDALVAKDIEHADTGYIESTLVRGGMLLKGLGVAEEEVDVLVKELQPNDYALIRAAIAGAGCS